MKIKLVIAAAAAAVFALQAQAGPKPQLAPAYVTLWCGKGSGDVVAHPIAKNTSGFSLLVGKKISFTINLAGGKVRHETHVLTSALLPGQTVALPKYYPWNFTCTAVAKL